MTEKTLFGKMPSGEHIDLITIKNTCGSSVEIISLGAIVRSINLAMPDGTIRDVALGYDTVEEYLADDAHLGSTIGRCANRIGAFDDTGVPGFVINGEKYYLAENNAKSIHLHGGYVGFDRHPFKYELGDNYAEFSYTSPDGEENYPGNLTLQVKFMFDDENCLTIEYNAISDKDTVCNVTNHSYFNLAGHGSGTVINHRLKMLSDSITDVNELVIPNGNIISVKDTPLDFNDFHSFAERIDEDYPLLTLCRGYDHNYVFVSPDEFSAYNVNVASVKPMAVLESPTGDVKLTVSSDLPGAQIYTSNFLTERQGKGGAVYDFRGAVCIETQNLPNSINLPNFPSVILHAGEKITTVSTYKFDVY